MPCRHSDATTLAPWTQEDDDQSTLLVFPSVLKLLAQMCDGPMYLLGDDPRCKVDLASPWFFARPDQPKPRLTNSTQRCRFHRTRLCQVWLCVERSCAFSKPLQRFQPLNRSITDEAVSITCRTRHEYPHNNKKARVTDRSQHGLHPTFHVRRLPHVPTIRYIPCAVHHLCLSLWFWCATYVSLEEPSLRVTCPERI